MGLKDFNGYGCILADDMGLGKTLQQPGWVSFKKKHHGGCFRGFLGGCVLWRSFGWSPGFEFFHVSKGWRKTFGRGRLFLEQSVVTTWVVVSNIFFFIPIWGNDPILQILFKWVETTNQLQSELSWWFYEKFLWIKNSATNRSQHSNSSKPLIWRLLDCHVISLYPF